MKNLEKFLSSVFTQTAMQVVFTMFLGISAGVGGVKIYDEAKAHTVTLETLLQNDRALTDSINSVMKSNAVLTDFILKLSATEEKTSLLLSRMIRESSETPVNIPLIEKLEEDVKETVEELPHRFVAGDTVKHVIKHRKK